MEIFNWGDCESVRSRNIFLWLKENHAKKVSKSDYIEVMRALGRANRMAGDKKHLTSKKFANRISRARLSGNYDKLKSKYGFFV